MKQILNVQLWQILIISLFLSSCSVLSGFGWKSEKPIEVRTLEQERVKLNIDSPKPLTIEAMEWIVVTPENVNEVFKQLEEKNTDLVLFAITDDGYEKLASDMVLLRNYIAQQRLIIMKYKDYYEPEKDKNDN